MPSTIKTFVSQIYFMFKAQVMDTDYCLVVLQQRDGTVMNSKCYYVGLLVFLSKCCLYIEFITTKHIFLHRGLLMKKKAHSCLSLIG